MVKPPKNIHYWLFLFVSFVALAIIASDGMKDAIGAACFSFLAGCCFERAHCDFHIRNAQKGSDAGKIQDD